MTEYVTVAQYVSDVVDVFGLLWRQFTSFNDSVFCCQSCFSCSSCIFFFRSERRMGSETLRTVGSPFRG